VLQLLLTGPTVGAETAAAALLAGKGVRSLLGPPAKAGALKLLLLPPDAAAAVIVAAKLLLLVLVLAVVMPPTAAVATGTSSLRRLCSGSCKLGSTRLPGKAAAASGSVAGCLTAVELVAREDAALVLAGGAAAAVLVRGVELGRLRNSLAGLPAVIAAATSSSDAHDAPVDAAEPVACALAAVGAVANGVPAAACGLPVRSTGSLNGLAAGLARLGVSCPWFVALADVAELKACADEKMTL
jgi:hypothetical protein